MTRALCTFEDGIDKFSGTKSTGEVFFREEMAECELSCGSLSFLLIVQNRYVPRKMNSATRDKGPEEEHNFCTVSLHESG